MDGNSDVLNRAYLDRITVAWRHLAGGPATTECELFGKKLATPIMCGGMAFYEKLNPGGAPLFAEGAKAAGTAMWSGFCTDEAFEDIIAVGAPAARIIKPFADRDRVLSLIAHDEAAGAAAFAMDIDHLYNKKGGIDDFFHAPYEVQTRETLELYRRSTRLPFFPKGVLSVHDALICAEAGVAGIVISQHQNMFPWTAPPLAVLPEIRKAVGDKMTILVDSGIETGYDAFKALALGADGVFIARPLRTEFAEKGADGVSSRILRMTDELRACLSKTASPDIRHINPEVLRML